MYVKEALSAEETEQYEVSFREDGQEKIEKQEITTSGKIDKDAAIQVVCTNIKKVQEVNTLQISKTMERTDGLTAAEKEKAFTFHITLKNCQDFAGGVVPAELRKANGTTSSLDVTFAPQEKGCTAEVTLKHGETLPRLIAQIANSSAAAETEEVPVNVTVADKELYTVTINDQNYIGYVIIPALNLELAVMADWSYPQLKTAPCRFSGTLEGDDLVVMAHNYARHFGSLQSLVEGDSVYFRDVSGDTVEYQVAKVEILKPTAVEEMTAGEYDLTLFTCTYGGQSRVAVRCNRSVQ